MDDLAAGLKRELPLTAEQRDIWFSQMMKPEDTHFNCGRVVLVQGELNVRLLSESVKDVVRKNSALALRMCGTTSRPSQIVDAQTFSGLELSDVSDAASPDSAALEFAKGKIKQRHDLHGGALFRSGLVRAGNRRYYWWYGYHHIIVDGLGGSQIFSHVVAAYNGVRGNELADARSACDYVDFIAENEAYLSSAQFENDRSFWSEKFVAAPKQLFAEGSSEHASCASGRRCLEWEVDRSVYLSIGAVARKGGGSESHFMLALLSSYFSRVANTESVVVGLSIHNRYGNYKSTIGMFSSVLPIEVSVDGDVGFLDHLAKVGRETRECMRHARTPISEINRRSLKVSGGKHYQLQQVGLSVENYKFVETFAGTQSHMLYFVRADLLPLMICVQNFQPSDTVKIVFDFDPMLVEPDVVASMKERLGVMLDAVLEDPSCPIGEIPILGRLERSRLLLDWNRVSPAGSPAGAYEIFKSRVSGAPDLAAPTGVGEVGTLGESDLGVDQGPAARERIMERSAAARSAKDKCVHELFAEQAAKTPDAVAVTHEDGQLSYGELDRRSNQLAHHLRGLGVGPEVVVGLCMERSLDLVVGLLGILKAGAAYLPLDPNYPPQRLAYMVADAKVSVLLTQSALAGVVPDDAGVTVLLDADHAAIERQPETPLVGEVRPDNLAYVIYTSGSSGRPKGVMGLHRGIVNRVAAQQGIAALSEVDRCAQKTSIGFVDSVFELVGPLTSGGQLTIAGEATSKSPDELVALLQTARITRLVTVPSLAAAMLAVPRVDRRLDMLRSWTLSGEALSGELLAQLSSALPSCRFVNLYGSTEVAADATCHVADGGEGRSVPIGSPIANVRAYVLDRYLEPAPVGVTGELYIGGAALARGYIGRAGLTAERFIPSPFGNGERLYRTGDLSCWRADGELECHGRSDHQVKLRGYRIELGEIEAKLNEHAAIGKAVVIAREDEPGEPRLVAYAVGTADGAELRAHLKRSLPDYMVPSVFVLLDQLPLTASGKVDRLALPAPEEDAVVHGRYVAPRTPTEEVLAEIWAEMLRLDRVGIDDNFFELGGHSLIATRVIAQVRDSFAIDLPVRVLFDATATVRALAERVEAARREEQGLPLPALVPQPRSNTVSLSFAQERLWLLEQLYSLGGTYHEAMGFRLEGSLDVPALERVFGELMRRHESLRTRFAMSDGGVVQAIEPAQPFPLAVTDLSPAKDEKEREAALRDLMQAELTRPFDLARGPLIRAGVLRLSSQEHVVLVTMHHIVSDGWSMRSVLPRELGVLYAAFSQGRLSPLPELAVQYADYAVWQRGWLQGEVLEQQLAYWREWLSGAPVALELPTDRPRPPLPSFRGARLPVMLPMELRADLVELGRRHGATLYMVLLAAFQLLLARWSGQSDVVVGSPIAGRTHRQTEGLIGFFVNTLVMRADISDDPSFEELLARVKEAALGAYAHQDIPFEKLVEQLQPQRDLSRQPLFQVMFALQNVPQQNLELPGLRLMPMEQAQGTAKFDLFLQVTETTSGLVGNIEYATDLFERATIERLLSSYVTLLEGIVAEPQRRVSDYALLSVAGREHVVVERNATAADYATDKCVHALFAEQAAKTPDAVAVTHEDGQLSYGELDRRSNQLAHHLRRLGVGRETVVGLCMARSLDLVVGLLGILKAGGAYLPLDPGYPPQRLAYMMADAGMSVLLTQASLVAQLPEHGARMVLLDADHAAIEGQPETVPASGAGPDNLAYVIYTSGSSGRPKGVMGLHRGIVNRVAAQQGIAALSEVDRCAQKTSIGFVDSIFELIGPLLCGSQLTIAGEQAARSPDELVGLLEWARTTRLVTVPSLAAAMLAVPRADRRLDMLRSWTLSGEALSGELLAQLSSALPSCRFVNLYGSTEVAADATCHVADGGEGRSVPIGSPIANVQAYVLDDNLEPLPVGVAGELYIGGAGLSRGYVGRAGLTGERFVPNPFGAGGRLYRTGDLGRQLAGGGIGYAGRRDHQVKIRGFRIEPGEVEAAVVAHADVRQAVVVAREDVPGEPRLVAYVVGGADGAVLREHVKQHVPDYMVPSVFVLLDELPLTASGKVDRLALPAPEEDAVVHGRYVAPRTPTEEVLAEIWAEMLRLDRVGIDDNFFELGGHSLIATRVIAQVRDSFAIDLPVRVLFDATATVRALAERVEAARREEQGLPLPALVPQPRSNTVSLSFAQERLWLLEQLYSLGGTYHEAMGFRLEGSLDVPALERVFGELMRRHESLRTRFAMSDGGVVQAIEPAQPFPLAVTDLSPAKDEKEREAALRDLMQAELTRPFDLARGPLIRAGVLRLSSQEHVVLVTMHHIVSDGWSMRSVLPRELGVLYAAFSQGRLSPLPELAVQYADYAVWQRGWLQGEVLEQQLAYWREWLSGAPVALELPTDRPRPPLPSFRGARLPVMLPMELRADLVELGRRHGATLYMVLLAAFQLLLARWSGQSDVVVGSPIAGRTHRQTEGLIGFFVNTLVMRADISDDPSFEELLARVKEAALGAYAHQDIPFEKLVEHLLPQRDLSRQPLFQVMFALQNVPQQNLELPGLRLMPMEQAQGTAKFDLFLQVTETTSGLVGNIEYATDLFERATIERLLSSYVTLLEGIVAEPQRRVSDYALLSVAGREHVVVERNATAADYATDKCVHALFAEQAAKTPDAVAVTHEDGQLSYGELDRRSNQLAHHLRRLGVGRETVVGLCMARSLDLVVGLLGILKAGGAYLPLDPGYPPQRLAYMMADAGMSVLLTQASLVAQLPEHGARMVLLDADHAAIEGQPETVPASGAGPDNLAYVIYTSGSSGRPKGVMGLHRGIVNRVAAQQGIAALSEVDRCAQKTSIGFVDSIFELIGPLLCGSQLTIAGEQAARSPDELVGLLEWARTTRLVTVPSLAAAMLAVPRADRRLDMLRSWTLSGEALSGELLAQLSSALPSCRFVNLYGSTEVAADATCHVADGGEGRSVPIGSPIANVQAYVLDDNLEPLPVGVAGELYIGGAGLSRGYVGRAGLTGERFVPNPFGAGGRLYRTGDLGRQLAGGGIGYAGRRDHQVKIRGFRIEPGEVEAAVVAHADVRQAVVVAREDVPGEPRLVAYVVGGADGAVLREHVKQHVPDYMVPSVFVLLDELPLTASGKVDRRALPAPARRAEVAGYVAPRTPVEDMLASIWAELLQLDRVGINDNFFKIGGHSLLAMRVVSRVHEKLGAKLSLSELFETPVIAKLGEKLARRRQLELLAQDEDLKVKIDAMSSAEVRKALQQLEAAT